jgi:hypothetical protein
MLFKYFSNENLSLNTSNVLNLPPLSLLYFDTKCSDQNSLNLCLRALKQLFPFVALPECVIAIFREADIFQMKLNQEKMPLLGFIKGRI